MKKRKILINGSVSLAIAVASVVAIASQKPASASEIERLEGQIKVLQSQAEEARGKALELQKEAQSIQNKIDGISRQRESIEAQIKILQAQHEKLQIEIKQTEEKIENNRKALGKTLVEMSLENDVSPIERLAGSDNLSKALDNLEYQSAVKTSLKNKIGEIKNQKAELEEKRDKVKKTLADQERFRGELQAKISEQNALMLKARGEEAEYEKYAKDRDSQREKLQEQQRRAFEEAQRKARASTGGGFVISGADSGGGYTWGNGCWVGTDLYSHGPNDGVDPLGYGCRQCVSYTAFKALQVFGKKLLWWGNANMWPASARASGYRTGYTPKANSVGVQYIGYYGHVVWIDSVNANGTVNISQYNYPVNGKWGQYSTMTISASAIHEYIYFD